MMDRGYAITHTEGEWNGLLWGRERESRLIGGYGVCAVSKRTRTAEPVRRVTTPRVSEARPLDEERDRLSSQGNPRYGRPMA